MEFCFYIKISKLNVFWCKQWGNTLSFFIPKELENYSKIIFGIKSIRLLPDFGFPLFNWKRVCFLTSSADSSSAASFQAKHCFSICKLTMCFKNLLGWTPIFWSCFLKFCWLPSYFFFFQMKGEQQSDGERQRENERAWKMIWGHFRSSSAWLTPAKKISFSQHQWIHCDLGTVP